MKIHHTLILIGSTAFGLSACEMTTEDEIDNYRSMSCSELINEARFWETNREEAEIDILVGLSDRRGGEGVNNGLTDAEFAADELEDAERSLAILRTLIAERGCRT